MANEYNISGEINTIKYETPIKGRDMRIAIAAALEKLVTSVDKVPGIVDRWENAEVGDLDSQLEKIAISTVAWIETSVSSVSRTVTISGVTSLSDILNVQLNVVSKAAGADAETTLNVNGLGAIPIVFPNGVRKGWTYIGHVYCVTYNGTSFIANNSQAITAVKGSAETDYRVGEVSLDLSNLGYSVADNLTSTSTEELLAASQGKALKDLLDNLVTVGDAGALYGSVQIGDVKICWGNVTITPSAANTPTSAEVTFPLTFSSTPVIITGVRASVVGTVVLGTSASDQSKTGCKIWATRTNTTVTGVNYIAIGV